MKKKLYVNLDDSHWNNWLNNICVNGQISEDKIKEYIKWYVGNDVTDLLFCIFCQSSNVPSDVMTFRGNMYPIDIQNGISVDCSRWRWCHDFYNINNIDIFKIWFDTCREFNLNPWMSIRMNDCHFPFDNASFLRGDLYYIAKENGWIIGDDYDYYQICLDYSIPQVRKIMLDYIAEQLLRYDVYGIELDWMREIHCFDYKRADTNEINGVMNDFMRSVRMIVNEAEIKWGHCIKINARLNRDIDQAYIFGFDARTWAKEKLVDSITVSPRWATNDSGMPIEKWKKETKEIEIFACLETNICDSIYKADSASICGYANQYLSAGADGIYLFNFMKKSPADSRSDELFKVLGEFDKIKNSHRRHIITWQDVYPYNIEPYKPLDKEILLGESYSLDVETGYIPEGRLSRLILGFDKQFDSHDVSVSVNGFICTLSRNLSNDNGKMANDIYTDENTYTYTYEYSFDGYSKINTIQKVRIVSNNFDLIKLKYCEIDII